MNVLGSIRHVLPTPEAAIRCRLMARVLPATRVLHIRKDSPEMPLDGGVAFAGSFLEPGAIRDRDLAAAIMDEAFALQRLCRGGNGRALHAEQLGEKLLRQREIAC